MTRTARLLVAVVAACLASAWWTPARTQERARSVTFVGATVLDGLGGRRDTPVSVSDGRIRLAALSGPRYEIRGAYLTPGLIDAACRTGYLRGEAEITRELTAFVDAADLADPRSSEFREAAYEGCTTVVLVPGPRNVIGGLSQVFHAWSGANRARPVKDAPKSLHAALSGRPSSGNFPPRFGATTSIYARRPTTRMGVVWLLRQTFLAAKGVQTATNDADLQPYKQVLEGRRPLRVLCHRLQDINATLRLADEVGFKVVFDGAEEAYLKRDVLADRKVAVVVGPLPNVRSGTGPDFTDTALRNAAMLREKGVRVALTAGDSGPRWLREQAMFAVRYGLSRDAALAAVTSVPADLCGLRDRGRIEEGAVGDLVLWSGHPLLPTSRMLVVVIDGEVIFDRTKEDER